MQIDMEFCPFCKTYSVEIFRQPSVWSERRTGRGSLGRGASVHKSREIVMVKSDCHNCHKTKEEIENWFKSNS